MPPEVRFARNAYRFAAIYGVIALVPAYFLPVPDPWRLTHFGFVGLALVFQGMFWIIARDPLRYIALMPLAVFEKLCFGVPAIAFWARGQTDGVTATFGAIDILFGAAFAVTLARLRRVSA